MPGTSGKTFWMRGDHPFAGNEGRQDMLKKPCSCADQAGHEGWAPANPE